MNSVVLMKCVPDLVEDLEIDSATGLLDRSFLRLIPNELDDHALEEALLLKERHGGTVTVLALDGGEVDEALFTAVAKGADRAIKITGISPEAPPGNRALAGVLQNVLTDLAWDLILTGTQAVDDLDGFAGSWLAARMELPYVGYVTKVTWSDGTVTARKEYPGGLCADIETTTPAVLGIQAAEKPPRYVVTNLVMQAMKTARIEEVDAGDFSAEAGLTVSAMSIPQSDARAEMIEGDASKVAARLAGLLRERGVLA